MAGIATSNTWIQIHTNPARSRRKDNLARYSTNPTTSFPATLLVVAVFLLVSLQSCMGNKMAGPVKEVGPRFASVLGRKEPEAAVGSMQRATRTSPRTCRWLPRCTLRLCLQRNSSFASPCSQWQQVAFGLWNWHFNGFLAYTGLALGTRPSKCFRGSSFWFPFFCCVAHRCFSHLADHSTAVNVASHPCIVK